MLDFILAELEHHAEGVFRMELRFLDLAPLEPTHEPDSLGLQMSNGLFDVRDLQGDGCQAFSSAFDGPVHGAILREAFDQLESDRLHRGSGVQFLRTLWFGEFRTQHLFEQLDGLVQVPDEHVDVIDLFDPDHDVNSLDPYTVRQLREFGLDHKIAAHIFEPAFGFKIHVVVVRGVGIEVGDAGIHYHLAQINIAQARAAMESELMEGFVSRLQEINALADQSPGFVWRLQTEEGDATDIDFFGPDYLVNMSVWEDVDCLRQFVYRSAHNKILARRRQWFDHMLEAYQVLWWIPADTMPTLEQAAARLESLQTTGPSSKAFTFKKTFDPE